MLPDNIQSAIQALHEQRKAYRNNPVSGERIELICPGKSPIDCILYHPKKTNSHSVLPLLIEVHGGAWFGGDATFMDSFCRKMADEVPCIVANLNYHKLDVHPFPYQQEEVCDLIQAVIAKENLDPIKRNPVVLCGQSAGAHICAGAAILAHERKIPLAHQMLVYPFVDFSGILVSTNEGNKGLEDLLKTYFFSIPVNHPYVSPLASPLEKLQGLCPATILVCGHDEIRPHGIHYQKKLTEAGVPAALIDYPEAIHGFLEVNRPDFVADHPAKSEEQARLSVQFENEIIRILREVK